MGCASSTKTISPSGRAAFIVKCPGDIDECFTEAAKTCPQGYNLIDRSTSKNGTIVPVGYALMAMQGPTTMLIECN